jgi:hypothetical protein
MEMILNDVSALMLFKFASKAVSSLQKVRNVPGLISPIHKKKTLQFIEVVSQNSSSVTSANVLSRPIFRNQLCLL